jgi:integrase/recombinase XerD
LTKELVKFNNSKSKSVDIKRAAWSALSIESQKAYQSDFDLFFSFIKKSPEEVTPNDVLLYIQHMEKQGLKNSTINRKLASISKMFHILELAGEIKRNPVKILKDLKGLSHKTSKDIKISLTINDIRKVTAIHGNSSDQDKKMSLIIRFLSMTGLRISEFINIKNSDITLYDKNTYKVRIVGKGKKERYIFLPMDLHQEVVRLYPLNNNVDYLFYTLRKHHYDRKVLWKQIHETFKKKIDIDVHPHTLRHFFITYKISIEKQDIKAVSRYVGHQDISTTLGMYVDTSLDVKSSKLDI